MLVIEGAFAWLNERYPEALEWLDRAEALARETDHPWALFESHRYRARVERDLGNRRASLREAHLAHALAAEQAGWRAHVCCAPSSSSSPCPWTTVARAPVLTGNLRRGIVLRALKPKGGVFGVRVAFAYRSQLGIPETYRWYYPAAVEFGRRTKGGGKTGARPFLRPAFDENKEPAMRTFLAALGDGVAKLWGAT